jgi:hypothetical protein
VQRSLYPAVFLSRSSITSKSSCASSISSAKHPQPSMVAAVHLPIQGMRLVGRVPGVRTASVEEGMPEDDQCQSVRAYPQVLEVVQAGVGEYDSWIDTQKEGHLFSESLCSPRKHLQDVSHRQTYFHLRRSRLDLRRW